MKLLKTISHPEYPTLGIETETREAARVVLVDDNGMCPLIYSSKFDVYKIPGGGIEQGEDIMTAAAREAMEEVGCEIEILGDLGEIVEQRPAHGYKKGINLVQHSYCYYGKVLKKGREHMTKAELQRGFSLIWINIKEVLPNMSLCRPTEFKVGLNFERDKYIFEEYLKIQKEAK